jgi:hypothetical protein
MGEERKSGAYWAFFGTLAAALLTCVGTVVAATIQVVPGVSSTILQTLQSGRSTPTARLEPGIILFQDDFSNPKSGWDRDNSDDGSQDYYDGGYRIYLKVPNLRGWANPGKRFGDVRVEVFATKIGGPDDNAFGVLCRYQDAGNYYYFVASSDGYAGIGLRLNGKSQLLSGDKLKSYSFINKGNAINQIRADCVGNTFTLYVNGQQASSVRDTAFLEGDVGLWSTTYDVGGVDIFFDNFVVYKPQ